MDKMFEFIDEMIGKMCSEDRMSMMQKIFDKCSEGLSEDDKKGFFEKTFAKSFPDGSKDSAEWDMLPRMTMSMMNMMCMMFMKDMMHGAHKHEAPQGGQPGRGPMMGMGGMGGMGGLGGKKNFNPMKMMQQMMGQSAAKTEPESTTDNTADDSG